MVLPLAAPHLDDDGVHAQLASLGTKLEYLLPALHAGEAARRTAAPNHPSNTAGTRAYQEHVRVIREEHIRHEGWQRLIHDHLELVCNPDHNLAIGVMVGDAATGNPRLHATNLHRRGAATERAAEQNTQLELFARPTGADEALLGEDESASLQTWFLVSYRAEVGDAVRIHSELSLPGQVKGGFVVDWQRRIPLPAIEMDGIELPDDDGVEEIDIQVDFR
ncbi:hypothetical protein RCO28_30260 [Streptomyces sp. LHD-70]|uniref:hypothetical protein n=1 Tax=Streptomyces sp. LHD-70 TaxID=3072140 RepID=UPI0028107862|nr:hypothetical protein [Streptomyces sp. LHD-70]MDQ8706725.1 hypothetical protein [Streptomyces sp. LHD-70]